MFVSTTACRTLVLCLALTLALGALGCAMGDDPGVEPDGVSEAPEVGPGPAQNLPTEDVATAPTEATLGTGHDNTTLARCFNPGEPNPVPEPHVEQWLQCQIDCRAAGGTFSGCHTSCCTKWAGCPQCYEQ